MSIIPINELNFTCYYCNNLIHIEDKKTIYDLMKNDPIFECPNCKNLIKIEQIENYIIDEIKDENLI